MASSTTHEAFRQIVVRAADAERADRLAAETHAVGATGLEERERENEITPILRAPTLKSAARSRADRNGDSWSALLTTR
jgi:hypothetical protein